MNFGTNLRNLRIQRGMTQQKLADAMHVSQASITAYENSVREPSFETVRKFAEYFNVPPTSLMPFEEATDADYVQRVADSLHKNPKLSLLFDKSRYLSESDLDTVLSVINAISRERENIER